MGRDNFGRLFLGFNDDDTRRNVTFGDQSPDLDALPQPAIVGDIRIRVGNNLTSLKWVCTVSGTPGTWVEVSLTGGGGILQFDSIGLVGTKLNAFDTTGQIQGTLAYVGNDTFAGQHSVQDFFALKYGENLSPDGKSVVNSPTFLTDGAQWVRLLLHNPANQQRGFWCIDPLNTSGVAHDENSGWGLTQALARLNPLRTMEELNRRMVGVILYGEVVFEQYSSFTGGSNAQLTNLRTAEFGYPVWLGRRVALFTGVISAYSALNPAANTRTTMTAASGLSGHVGKLVMNAAGTKTAWIQKDVSSGVVGLTPPTLGLAYPFAADAPTDFVVGETVSVYDVPILYDYPFPQAILFPAMQWVDRSGNAAEMAGTEPTISGCRFVDAFMNHPSNGLINGCLFVGDNYIFASGNSLVSNCGVLNGTLLCQLGVVGTGHGKLDIQNGRLQVADATFTCFTSACGIGIFDCVNSGILIQRGVGGRIQIESSGKIYGQGNTGHIIAIAVGTQSTVPLAANCTAVTSAAKPLLVEGVEYNYADMPIATLALTGLNNVDA